MITPVPPAALAAPAPTSRSIFRLLARSVGATNREADALRHALLSTWAEGSGADDLDARLASLDRSDPQGARGVDARLAIWFTIADPGNGRLVRDNDPVLTGLSDELRNRLAEMLREPQG